MFSILIRFRKPIYAFAPDIKQTFRMLEINHAQTQLQKFLWKDIQFSPMKVYELKSTTGHVSALYLATEVLQQLMASFRVLMVK